MWCALVAAVATSIAVVSCGGTGAPAAGAAGNPESAAPDRIAVRVAPVERRAMNRVYATSATLRADRRATITARTRGVVRELLVEEGDRVGPDQPLANLENEEQRIALQRARTARDTLARELERATRLHAQALLSDEEFEVTRREAADAGHAASLAELELSRTTIRAPFAGTIVTRHLDAGANVSDGTPVYDLADLNPLYTDVNVPERHVSRLAPGQRVRLEVDAGAGSVDARIERLAPEVDVETGTVKVTLAVEGGVRLRPGSFVRVGIVTDTRDDALVVPRSALVSDGRRWKLFRLADSGDTVSEVQVTLGFEEGDRVEVVEVDGAGGALSPGDRVVVRGAAALSDGAAVSVREEGEETEDESVGA